MIDVLNQKWDFSMEERFAIEWFENHGYDLRLEKQYISKSIFTVSKDGISDKFELPQGLKKTEVVKYMAQYKKNWETLCELRSLQREAGDRFKGGVDRLEENG